MILILKTLMLRRLVMPARKIKNRDGTYRVVSSGGVHAKSTSKAKAEAQIRLLNAIEHGFVPSKNKKRKKKKGKK